MDIKELVKLQVIGQMNLGNNNQKQNGSGSGMSFKTVFCQFLLMMLMSLIDDIAKFIPKFTSELKNKVGSYFSMKVKEKISKIEEHSQPLLSEQSIALSTRHNVNSLVMTRVYVDKTNSTSSTSTNSACASDEANGMVDAILAKIAKLDNVPTFSLINTGQVMIAYKEKPIQLTRDIYVKIDSISPSQNGSLSSLKLTILSNTLSAAEIANYVRDLYDKHLQELKNALGNKIFFFDQKNTNSQPPPLPASSDATSIFNHKRMMINSAPKNLSFTMTPFYSNKTFDNICGKEIRTIEKRVRFFMENKQWYDQKGIPYQLGLLLSGVPGAGKTSAIRAIANLTKRHIVNVNFANITTATQLKNLFYSDKITVYTDASMNNSQSYYIPIDQRLYVLEEIDAIGDIVKQRSSTSNGSSSSNNMTCNDELTLMEILTVLDGTIEVPGRIIIMTTNHPEVLDAALIRPGRIDVQVKFGYADLALISEMYEAYLDSPLEKDDYARVPEGILSPAEVGQVLFRHFGSGSKSVAVVDDLIATAHAKRSQSSFKSLDVPGSSNESNIDSNPKNEIKSTVDPIHTPKVEPGKEVKDADNKGNEFIAVDPVLKPKIEPSKITKDDKENEPLLCPFEDSMIKPNVEVSKVNQPIRYPVSKPSVKSNHSNESSDDQITKSLTIDRISNMKKEGWFTQLFDETDNVDEIPIACNTFKVKNINEHEGVPVAFNTYTEDTASWHENDKVHCL